MQDENQKGFRRLQIFREAHELTLLVYRVTKTFPRDELFGLTSQIRRAVISIAANIVEGQARTSKREFLQFLSISNGSLVEVEYYIELSHDLGYLNNEDWNLLYDKRRTVGILLHSFMKALRVQASLTH